MTSNVILVKKVVLKSESMVSLGELNQNTSGFINMNYRFLQVKMRLQRREIFIYLGIIVVFCFIADKIQGKHDLNFQKSITQK